MSERNIIAKIQQRFKRDSEELVQGIGDDCAVFADSEHLCWLISTDLLVEDVHFVLKWHEPFILGKKAASVNISDIAAMGGQPKFVLASLVIPPGISADWLNSYHSGMQAVLDQHSCILIGGDISRGEKLTASIAVIGSASPKQVVYRSGAGAGQDIFVTGCLGSSAGGLELLKRGMQKQTEFAELLSAHLDPVAQVEIGRTLAQSGLVTSMQDISDGIATDLGHICVASNISAVLDAERIPYAKALANLCGSLGASLLEFTLFGGEDYQLVLTARPEHGDELLKTANHLGETITKVGETRKGPPEVFLLENGRETAISFKGFEHR